MIVPILHFVWSGKRFPLAFALAVRSARAHNPGMGCVVHLGVEPETEAWRELLPDLDVDRTPPEALLESVPGLGRRLLAHYERIPAEYPAGRSNLVRLAVLYAQGGWYLDFDTLSLAPIDRGIPPSATAVVGEEWVWKHDQARVERGLRPYMAPSLVAFGLSWVGARSGCIPAESALEGALRRWWGRRELNNAVLGCTPGHAWFHRLLELALEQDPTVRFALGPALVNRAWDDPAGAPLPHRCPPETYYAFPPSQTARFFRGGKVDEARTNLLHWCSSNHRELVPGLDADWIETHRDEGPWPRAAAALMSSNGRSSRAP